MRSLAKSTYLQVLILALLVLPTGSAQPAELPLPTFTDVTQTAGIDAPHRAVWDPDHSQQGYLAVGQAWGDFNNNGWLDLYVTGNLAANVLYENQGDGTFVVSEYSRQVSLANGKSGGAVWVDFNNDGLLDLYVLNDGPNVLFMNTGSGFVDVTDTAGVGDAGKGKSAAWGDYNGDGFIDLYVVNWSCIPECDPEDEELSRDRLYRNNGDDTFTDVTELLPGDKTLGAGFAASFVDIDNDGYLDIYVVNDKVRTPVGNVLWRNDGPGCGGWCWTDISQESGALATIHGMGLAVGDYTNDQYQDFYVSNMMSPMLLLENHGQRRFTDSTQAAGVGINPPGNAAGWGTGFFDYDNDGWLDLYLAATGMPALGGSFYGGVAPDMEDFRRPYPDSLFRNNGDGTFSDVSTQSWAENSYPSMGFAYADYTNNGWIDFIQGNWNEGYRLFRNNGADNGHNWLTLRLVGGGSVNRDAAGARAYLTTTDGLTQMREVIIGSSFGSGNDPRLHFGLGTAEVSGLEIVWPNGLRQSFSQVPVNQIWQINYTNGADDAQVATDWFRLALGMVQDSPDFNPPVASRAFAYLGVTLYEAVVPGLPDYQSLVGQLNGLADLPEIDAAQRYNWQIVASSALAQVSHHLFSGASNDERINALAETQLRRLTLGQPSEVIERSVVHGQALAEAIHEWSLTDGSQAEERVSAAVPASAGPGMWLSTPPAFAPALKPGWGNNRTFILSDGGDCPVTPPLAYSESPASAFYQEALEVYHTVQQLSAEQREIALYWADNPVETATPPGHWIAILTQILTEGGYSLERAAASYVRLNTALADSFIACWHAKYVYNLLRPLTYIQQVIDSSWNNPELSDPVVTPPFPEYPSGHSVQSGAAAQVLTAMFGDMPFTDRTHLQRGHAPRQFDSFWQAAEEAAISRLYGGIHFRAAIVQGVAQGRCIGEKVNALVLKRGNP